MNNEKTGSLIRRLRRERGLVKDDSLLLRKLYPEWEVQTRLPFWGHSRLYFYCTQHGLFWQKV